MADQPQLKPADLREVIARFVAVEEVINDVDEEKWREADEEAMSYLVAGARVNLIRMLEAKYPGCMYLFADPRVDDKAQVRIGTDRLMSRKIRMRFHAFIFSPEPIGAVQDPESKAGFTTWAWRVLQAFHREDPIESLADAWAMGMRPKGGETLA